MELLIQTQDALARAVELSDQFKYQEGYNALFTVLNGIHSKLGYVAQHKETVEAIVEMGGDLVNYASSTRDMVRKVDNIRENNYEKVTEQLTNEIQLATNEIGNSDCKPYRAILSWSQSNRNPVKDNANW